MSITGRIRNILMSGPARSVTAKKNMIGSVAVKGLSILIQLILVPLTLGYLSDAMFGIWLTVSSVMLWFNFFDVGFTLGLRNKLAEALAVGDMERGKQLVSTTYGMMLLIFVPLCVVLEFVVPHINWSGFLNVAAEYNEELSAVMEVLVVCFCLQMIFNTITAVLSAYQRTALASAFPVIGNALSVVVIYVLIKMVPPSLLTLAEAVSFLPVIVLAVSTVWLFSGQLKGVAPSFRMFDSGAVKSLFGLGVKFFIIQIQMIVMYQCTNILISNVANPEAVTAYNIAYRYLSTGLMIFTIILNPLWPAFTDAYAKGDYEWMRNVYRRMKRLSYIMIGGILVMAIVSPVVYHIWIGDETTIPVMMTWSVALYSIILSWVTLQITLINGIGAIKLQTYVTLIGLFCNIPLSLFLGRYMGAVGVVTSMSLINLIYAVIFTVQINKLLNKDSGSIWHA